MNMTEVKAVAKDLGVMPGKMKKEDLIRTIQLAEGNPQCFNTNFS
ncbi:MAG: SAP domain-containing protein, partial [Desulfuromonadales bacterium]|nr:SAP domain-containing protein [Desulfuromonadales bacterium]